ncbi:ABC transporter ATP-binding protein [Sulfobacillus harzensis]|uniref:ABC transporter ATP-binding protein n=1 Tax=Sulfobacillus harzensis TaxID=2729629 RepID=UPI0030844BB0
MTKAYFSRGHREPLVAVQHVSLTIADGEFVSIVGPSGCGKTTLLNMVAGFEAPTQGQVMLDGTVIRRPGPERAVVFQQPSLLPWMTVEENIAFGMMLASGRQGVDASKVKEMVEVMGLQGFESHRPYQLSGGMQQRVAIARALMTEPRILLMDEPFGALDAQTRSEMQRFLLDLWKVNRPTVLFVTHDVEEAVLLGDRVVVMSTRPGEVAMDLTIELPRPRHWDLVLSGTFTDYKRRILAVLRPS